MVAQIWRRNWDHITPFFAYPEEIRKVIYTTNAIESLNMSLRKIIKMRGSFPNDEAALKLFTWRCGMRRKNGPCHRQLEGGLESLQHPVAGPDARGGAKLMPTEWVSFAEVKAAVNMRLVLEHYGVLDRLRPSGQQQYRGCCPIHRGEGRDAFHAHLGKNVFHCFACGAGGNVLDLVAELEQCSTREAALRIQRRFLAGGTGCLPRRLEPGKDKLVREKERGIRLFFLSRRLGSRVSLCVGTGIEPRDARTLSGVTRREKAGARRDLDRRVTSDKDV